MRWKWILMIGTILIIALMVTVYVVVSTYDYDKLKPQIARLVKDATGRELNLGGEVNLDFGFSPALVVTDVTFANASWGSQPEMIKVEQLQAQVQLLPKMSSSRKSHLWVSMCFSKRIAPEEAIGTFLLPTAQLKKPGHSKFRK